MHTAALIREMILPSKFLSMVVVNKNKQCAQKDGLFLILNLALKHTILEALAGGGSFYTLSRHIAINSFLGIVYEDIRLYLLLCNHCKRVRKGGPLRSSFSIFLYLSLTLAFTSMSRLYLSFLCSLLLLRKDTCVVLLYVHLWYVSWIFLK